MAAVDIPAKATPQGPGEPVPVEQPVTQMGATFAERAAAAAGKKVPARKAVEVQENSTFADRTKAAGRSAKQVAGEDDGAENKAVKSAASKSRKS